MNSLILKFLYFSIPLFFTFILSCNVIAPKEKSVTEETEESPNVFVKVKGKPDLILNKDSFSKDIKVTTDFLSDNNFSSVLENGNFFLEIDSGVISLKPVKIILGSEGDGEFELNDNIVYPLPSADLPADIADFENLLDEIPDAKFQVTKKSVFALLSLVDSSNKQIGTPFNAYLVYNNTTKTVEVVIKPEMLLSKKLRGAFSIIISVFIIPVESMVKINGFDIGMIPYFQQEKRDIKILSVTGNGSAIDRFKNALIIEAENFSDKDKAALRKGDSKEEFGLDFTLNENKKIIATLPSAITEGKYQIRLLSLTGAAASDVDILKGEPGKGIVWLGDSDVDPENPVLNSAYYNPLKKGSFIFDGTSWKVLSKDGSDGKDGETGSNGVKGDKGAKGDIGPSGYVSLVDFINIQPGFECFAGGILLNYGIDNGDNGGIEDNFQLEQGEIDSTRILCNGINGLNGEHGSSIIWLGQFESDPLNPELNWAYYNLIDKASYIYNGFAWQILALDGENGSMGETGEKGDTGESGISTLISQVAEEPGENCVNGGIKISSGKDLNRNEILESEEISATDYVCNGNDAIATLGAPVIVSDPGNPAEILVNETFTYQVIASDPENDPVYYGLLRAPEEMTIDPYTGIIKWETDINDFGENTVIVFAVDNNNGIDTQVFDIVVKSEGSIVKIDPVTPPFSPEEGDLDQLNVIKTIPSDGAVNVNIASGILFFFDDKINPETINDLSVKTLENGVQVYGIFNYSLSEAGNTILSFIPFNHFMNGSTVEVFLDDTNSLLDDGNNPVSSAYSISFEIIDETPVFVQENFSFENLLDGWSCNGDCGVVDALGGYGDLEASHDSHFAMLTSANIPLVPGSLSASVDFQTSTLSSGLMDVPESAKFLTFDWNFWSDEFDEYVGSQYDDYLIIQIAGPFSSISQNLASVNIVGTEASFPVSIPGFPTDSSTTDETGLQTASFDIEQLGSPIQISFIISDVGDNVFSSGALIDNIRFEQSHLNPPPKDAAVSFNSEDVTPKDRYTSILLSANDDSGITAYCLKETSYAPSLNDDCWTEITAVKFLSLSVDFEFYNGSGEYVIHAWFSDTDGNITEGVSDIITHSQDSDDDGLTDEEEISAGSDPEDADSDDDTISDYDEVITHQTNPLLADSDADGLSDSEELLEHNTDPLDSDSDNDDLSDYDELITHLTDPLDADSDDDTMPDGDEVLVDNTDPLDADSDDDGLNDHVEIHIEFTDPLDDDTDDDGLSDGDEVSIHSTDPKDTDSDNDTLSDADEINTHLTDPLDTDSDNDGFSDSEEITENTDPNDPDDMPVTSGSTVTIEAGTPAFTPDANDLSTFSVLKTIPSNGATNVAASSGVIFFFDDEIDPTSIDDISVVITAGANQVIGSYTYSLSEAGNTILSFVPETSFQNSAVVSVSLITNNGLLDDGGNLISATLNFSFTIISETPVFEALNLSFETLLDGWSCTGDCGVISAPTGYGDLEPTDGSYFAMITSNDSASFSGSLAGAIDDQTSTLSSGSFNVPVNATHLVFDWNFWSEEFDDYVGSEFDDYLIVQITGPNGSINTTLASVNKVGAIASTPANIPGFSAQEAGAQSSSFDIQQLGSPIEISFIVSDVGDSAFSSGALIDNIHFSQIN